MFKHLFYSLPPVLQSLIIALGIGALGWLHLYFSGGF